MMEEWTTERVHVAVSSRIFLPENLMWLPRTRQYPKAHGVITQNTTVYKYNSKLSQAVTGVVRGLNLEQYIF
jgi:hypothetical protein